MTPFSSKLAGMHSFDIIVNVCALKNSNRNNRSVRIEMFHLEKVYGVTVSSNGAVASHSKSDLIAYPAGSTVVLSNVTNYEQHHIINRSKKAIKSLDFTPCGKYLIFSEHGQNSAIKIWNVQADNIKQIGEIHPEDNGTRCFAISPCSNKVVTFGYNLSLSLWDRKKKTKLSGNKISAEVKRISFSQNGKYFVTVGNKHIKYWYLEDSSLNGKPVILNELKDVSFCDVACGKGRCCEYTYVVTRCGVLWLFGEERMLEESVRLETGINCLVVSEHFVFVGCNDAIISSFDSLRLKHLFNLPKCHSLGDLHNEVLLKDAPYPDTIAMTFCEANNTLISIYNDHSLYIWNLQNGGGNITKSHAFLYHSNCIWDMKICSDENDEADRFLTCSSDNTVRSWTIGNLNPEKIICADNDYNYLKDVPRDKTDLYYGIRCLSISSDRIDISCGDRKGNIKIYKLESMRISLEIQEHNLEVLCLDYTPLNSNYNLLASAGKDKDICIFNVNENYSVIQKIKDHSNSVTTVKFSNSKDGVLKLISSSNDGSCIVRSSKSRGSGSIYFVTDYNISIKATLYNVELDVDAKFIFMASQNLKIFNMDSRQVTKTLKSPSKGSFVFKIALDASKKYIATSCLDKSIIVYDFDTSNHLATVYSNLVTSLCFTQDCKRLIAVTGDGCIFIWRIINEMNALQSNEELLPVWAKKSQTKTADIVVSTKSILPRGKWANRIENTISIKSSYISEESDVSLQTPDPPLTPYFSEDFSKLDRQFFSSETQSSTDTSLDLVIQTSDTHPVKPPRRRMRQPNLKSISNSSSSKESLDMGNQRKNKEEFNIKKINDPKSYKSTQEDIGLIKHEVKMPKTSNVDSKIPIAVRRESIDSEKREKASLLIGDVKRKLEGISQRNQLRSSKSMHDLSQQPSKGSWLLTYRTSFEGQKNQMRKQGSMGDLTKGKYYSNVQSNQVGIDVKYKTPSKLPKPISNSDNSQVIRDNKLIAKSATKRNPSKLDLTSSRNEPRLKLSLAKPHLLLRTGTDPQITLRRKKKNESNLASIDKHLSASNNELNLADSFHDLNMSTVKITEQICERAGSELIDAATKAAELYKKFLNDDSNGSNNLTVIENLALSLVWAQIKLQRLNV